MGEGHAFAQGTRQGENAENINILIVDDEPIILKGIRSTLDWESAGITGVYTAPSAEEALALAAETKMDILVTDVRMSGMSGLDLLRSIKKDDPEVKSIIITAYDDFAYAQEGLRLHADDFLIKPIDENELYRKILELSRQIADSRRARNEELLSGRVLGNQSQQKMEKVMRELIGGKSDPAQIMRTIRELAGYGDKGEVRLLILHSFEQQPFSEEDRQFYRYLIFDFCLNNIDCTQNGISFHDERGNICMAYFCREESPADLADIREFLSLLCAELEVDAGLAIGCRVKELRDLARSYKDACAQVHESRLIDAVSGKSTPPGEVAGREQLYWDVISEIEKYILLEKDDPEQIRHIFDTFSRMVESYDVPDETVRLSSYKLLTMLFYGKGGSADPQLDIGEYLKMLSSSDRDEILRITNEIMDSMSGTHTQEPSLVVEDTRQYIDSHLDEKLSVTELAGRQFLSPSHFSRLFKKETGEGCNEYIVRRRMEQAAFLLKTTHLKISEVAERIGYEDSNYFSLAFKKYYGKNPTEYRSA